MENRELCVLRKSSCPQLANPGKWGHVQQILDPHSSLSKAVPSSGVPGQEQDAPPSAMSEKVLLEDPGISSRCPRDQQLLSPRCRTAEFPRLQLSHGWFPNSTFPMPQVPSPVPELLLQAQQWSPFSMTWKEGFGFFPMHNFAHTPLCSALGSN